MGTSAWIRKWMGARSSEDHASALVRAAAGGDSLDLLLDLGVQALLVAADADRAGLWLAGDRQGESGRGRVVERLPGPIPEQWKHLDISTPFLRAALDSSEPLRVEIGANEKVLHLGPLVGMQAAIWIPLRTRNHTFGLAMVAHTKHAAHADMELLRARVRDEIASQYSGRECAHRRSDSQRPRSGKPRVRVLLLLSAGLLRRRAGREGSGVVVAAREPSLEGRHRQQHTDMARTAWDAISREAQAPFSAPRNKAEWFGPAPVSAIRRWRGRLLFGAAVGGLGILGWHNGRDPTSLALALALAVLCCWPLLQFQRSPGRLPMLPVLGGVYLSYYALPVFVRPELTILDRPLSDHAIHGALLAALLGWSGSSRTAVPLPRRVRPGISPRAEFEANRFRRRTPCGNLIHQPPAGERYPHTSSHHRPCSIRKCTRVLSPGQARSARQAAPRHSIPRLGGALPCGRAPHGLRSQSLRMLLLFIGVLLGRWQRTGRLPWWPILFAAALFAPLQHVKGQFRDLTLTGGRFWFLSCPSGESPALRGTCGRLREQGFRRRARRCSPAHRLPDHPCARDDQHAFPRSLLERRNILSAIWVLVPRFLAPDKPLAALAQTFGHH